MKENHSNYSDVGKVLQILKNYNLIAIDHKNIAVSPIFGFRNFYSSATAIKRIFRENKNSIGNAYKAYSLSKLNKRLTEIGQSIEVCLDDVKDSNADDLKRFLNDYLQCTYWYQLKLSHVVVVNK